MQQLTLEALELGPLLHPGLPLPLSGGDSSPPSKERAENIAEPGAGSHGGSPAPRTAEMGYS